MVNVERFTELKMESLSICVVYSVTLVSNLGRIRSIIDVDFEIHVTIMRPKVYLNQWYLDFHSVALPNRFVLT